MSKAADQKDYDIIVRQEKELVFDEFNNDCAWKLGNCMVQEAEKRKVSVAVEIEIYNYTVFHYSMPGTAAYHNYWLRRKINTAKMLQKSSLRAQYMPLVGEDDINEYAGLDLSEYCKSGGAFPLFGKNGAMIGVAAVSGLTALGDNNLCVDCIAKMLGKKVVTIPEK